LTRKRILFTVGTAFISIAIGIVVKIVTPYGLVVSVIVGAISLVIGLLITSQDSSEIIDSSQPKSSLFTSTVTQEPPQQSEVFLGFFSDPALQKIVADFEDTFYQGRPGGKIRDIESFADTLLDSIETSDHDLKYFKEKLKAMHLKAIRRENPDLKSATQRLIQHIDRVRSKRRN
jgi:hypothetical protein